MDTLITALREQQRGDRAIDTASFNAHIALTRQLADRLGIMPGGAHESGFVGLWLPAYNGTNALLPAGSVVLLQENTGWADEADAIRRPLIAVAPVTGNETLIGVTLSIAEEDQETAVALVGRCAINLDGLGSGEYASPVAEEIAGTLEADGRWPVVWLRDSDSLRAVVVLGGTGAASGGSGLNGLNWEFLEHSGS